MFNKMWLHVLAS